MIRHVPNVLSFGRLVCAVAFPLATRAWWLPLTLVAGASDWFDGYLARRFRVTSWVGGLLDGLSDKAFVVTALATMAAAGELSWYQVPFLLLRDFSVASGVTVSALRRDRDAFQNMDSRTFGKLTTVVIFGLLVAIQLWPESSTLHGVIYGAGVLLSAAAGVDYFLARHKRIMGREVAE